MIYLAAFLLPFVLWVFFLAYSALLANWHSLSPEVKTMGVVVVLIGALIDIGFNWTAGLALGITPDWTFSQKCGRLKYGAPGWRQSFACYLCRNWLDPFQLGGHCK